MRYIKKIVNRLKNDGLKATLVHYYNLIATLFINFARNIAKNLKFSLPLKDYIVFECESDMDDNPRAVYEYMVKNNYNAKYRLIWLVKNVDFCKKNYSQKNVVFLSRFDESVKNQIILNYYLSTAKWFIFSHPYWFKKYNKKQLIIHVGHGTPIKQTSKNFISDCYDVMSVPTINVLEWYTKFWKCDKDRTFICGLPRNDLLFIDECKKNGILTKIIPKYTNERVIICMPTYRQSVTRTDNNSEDTYSLGVVNTEEQFLHLNDVLSKLHIHLIVKIHPLQKIDNLKIDNISNIHYIQNSDLFYKKILLYELLGCCDSLVTDISSVVFDFLLLNRPVAFFMNDYNTYSRGYILDDPTEYMPGVKIHQYEDFITYLESFENNDDIYSVDRMRVCKFTNGENNQNISFCENFIKCLFD